MKPPEINVNESTLRYIRLYSYFVATYTFLRVSDYEKILETLNYINQLIKERIVKNERFYFKKLKSHILSSLEEIKKCKKDDKNIHQIKTLKSNILAARSICVMRILNLSRVVK